MDRTLRRLTVAIIGALMMGGGALLFAVAKILPVPDAVRSALSWIVDVLVLSGYLTVLIGLGGSLLRMLDNGG